MRENVALLAWIVVAVGGVALTDLDFSIVWVLVGFAIYSIIAPFDPGPYSGGYPGA